MTNVNVMQVTEDKEACSKDNARHTTVCKIATFQHLHNLSDTLTIKQYMYTNDVKPNPASGIPIRVKLKAGTFVLPNSLNY